MDQEWEGPVTADMSAAAARSAEVGARLPVWVECRCGHGWQSRARDRMTIKCPECGTGQRVPYRTYENTGPEPERRRPVARPYVPRREPVWDDRTPEDPWEDEPDRTAPVRTSDVLARVLAAFQGQGRPVPAPVRPAAPARRAVPAAAPARHLAPVVAPRSVPARRHPSAPVPVAAPAAGVEPVDVTALPLREQGRRDRMSMLLRMLSTPLMVWYDQPAGLCEAMDTTLPRDRQRCPRTVTHGVRFFHDMTETDVFTCAEHVGPMAATAARSPYIRAVPYGIR